MHSKGQKQKYGGRFNDELDAAKKVNQLCEEFGIPQKNPTIIGIPNQQYQVLRNVFLCHGIMRKSELQKIYCFNFQNSFFFVNSNNFSNKTFLHFFSFPPKNESFGNKV